MSSSDIERWNAIAESWHRWIPKMHVWSEPATELMLDLAQINPGDSVLDIAAGDGDQSLAAAARVGPSGRVLAIDKADKLLFIAAQSAAKAGVSHLETRIMDGENLELPEKSFDGAVCRFALRFFHNPVQALQGIGRVLKPDGRFSVVVYEENGEPEFLTALSTVQKYLGVERQVKPAATSLGTSEALERAFTSAGFSDMETHPLTLTVRMTSAKECIAYLQDTSPTLRDMLLPLPAQARVDAWHLVEDSLSKYVGQSGFEVYHRVLVAAGSAR